MWKKYKLGEVAELRKETYKPNGDDLPYIGLEHISSQSLRLNDIGSSKDVTSNKFRFYTGDILYGKLRPYFRKVYMPKFDGVCSTDIYVIKNKQVINRHFLFYLIASKDFTTVANSGSTGTHMPRADWNQLVESEWDLPTSIGEQESIASILSSLDDKIELNLQMNKNLEAIAQAIFKEWFVDFRFPGFDGELVDRLPKGWKRRKLNQVAQVEIGRTPPRMENQWFSTNDKDVKWISIRDMGNSGIFVLNTSEYLTLAAIEKFRIPIIPPNTVVLSFKLTIGRVGVTTERMVSNEAIAQIKSDTLDSDFIYCLLRNYHFDSLGSTSSIASAINSKIIKEMEVLVPEQKVVDKFCRLAGPVFNKIKNNSLEIKTITEIRDSLLPKLMTGKIRVA